MLNRRSFLRALAGLPVLGHVLQRAPLPTDTPLVTFTQWLDYPPAQTGGVPLHGITHTTYPEWSRYADTGTTMTDAQMRTYIANIQYHRAD